MEDGMSVNVLVVALLPAVACAQLSGTWRDPSPHRLQFVTLAEGVHLEPAGHFVFLTREADVIRELRTLLSPAAADLSGTWGIEAEFDDPSLSGGGFDCVFKQTGDRLTGSCQEIPLSGEVKGTNVAWRIKAGQTQDIITYTGAMNESGTFIKGRFSMTGKGGRFTASKQ
jgi:hypothetical protein